MNAPTPEKLRLWTRFILITNRPRRLFYNIFRRRYVAASMARRRGACTRCGACCQMGARCPFLRYENGLAVCRMYNRRRSANCRTFPIDERDLLERDLVFPGRPCGYTFEDSTGTK